MTSINHFGDDCSEARYDKIDRDSVWNLCQLSFPGSFNTGLIMKEAFK